MKTHSLIVAIALGASLCASAQGLADYQATVTNQNPSCYFTFDKGSLTNCLGSPAVTLTAFSPSFFTGQFAEDIFNNSSNSMYIITSGDVVYDPNEAADKLISGGGSPTLGSTAKGSVTLLFKMTDPGGVPSFTGSGSLGHNQLNIFSFGGHTANVAGFPCTNAFKLFVENLTTSTNNAGSLKLQFGNSETVLLLSNNIIWDAWYYFAVTYDETSTIGGQPNTNKANWYVGLLKGNGSLFSNTVTCDPSSVAGDASDFLLGATRNNSGVIGSSFKNPGTGQIDEVAVWSRQLTPAEIQAQFSTLPNLNPQPLSTYQSVITSQTPSHYFKLDGSSVDAMNPTTVVLSTNVPSWGQTSGYDYGYYLTPHSSFFISTSPDALFWNGNLLNGGGAYNGSPGSGQGSISFLFRSLGSYVNQGTKYLYSAGGSSTTTNGFALFLESNTGTTFPESLKLRFGGTSHVILSTNDFLRSTWYYFAMTYDEAAATATWWLAPLTPAGNGVMTNGSFSVEVGSLAGDGLTFVIGNNTNFNSAYRNSTPTGNGQVDEFAIWNRLLTGTEVTNQFNALVTPIPSGPPPMLSIVASGINVIISWPSSTDPGYGLQSTTNLAAPVWIDAGAPATVSSQYVVTNALSMKAQFYRLKK